MADAMDRAQDTSSEWTRRQIQDLHHRMAIQARRPSEQYCLECGQEIPEARREAVPGVRFCVTCQQYVDDGK
jgi:phage/conjugal plasmid C-4 type zinc finger TraR family protein